MTSTYEPSREILDRYADLLVNYALGGGAGIKPGDVVRIAAEESAKPLYTACRRAVHAAGGHVLSAYRPNSRDQYSDRAEDFYANATEEQLDFFPEKYMRGLAETIDHSLSIISEYDKHALKEVDPNKIMRGGIASKPFSDWLQSKESAGEFTWTLGLYGTPAAAAEAGLTLEEYWQQIITACFLDEEDPKARWRQVATEIEEFKDKLNALPIDTLHVSGSDSDLVIKLGEQRRWAGGSGRNIPSFEIFTSPDWRGTEGWIKFNQPLYRYGTLIEGVRLEFKEGKVVNATASQGQEALTAMIATENADKIGEFSLTDSRHSRITKFMAETLYDENVGGRYGNTHLAVGKSYHDCFEGDPEANDDQDWERLGFNNSSVHTDIVSTTDRTVVATLTDGTEKVIYADGQFTL